MLSMYQKMGQTDISTESQKNMHNFIKKIESDKIAEYTYWSVYLDIKQYYLGRVFIWAKRAEARDLLALTDPEYLEFRSILKDLKKMYDATFSPDELNIAFLGNEMPHCHGHIVPRYKESREFMGIIFHDENWGHNYSRPNTEKCKLNTTVHEKLREKLKITLEQIQNKNRNTIRNDSM